jgi:hypothetical protein
MHRCYTLPGAAELYACKASAGPLIMIVICHGLGGSARPNHAIESCWNAVSSVVRTDFLLRDHNSQVEETKHLSGACNTWYV